MNIIAINEISAPVAIFTADIDYIEDLDPDYAAERVRTLAGLGKDTPDVSELYFFALRNGVTFVKEISYTLVNTD